MAPNQRKPQAKEEKAAFTVDTRLFQELGKLLVGEDSTALLELVKNSYDADATLVTVHGEQLDSKRSGSIIVTDDGTGMTLGQFRKGFLRLAGRGKETGTRRSSRFGRRYTGEKGVGRLAAHKLARNVDVDSLRWTKKGHSSRAVHAHIDWAAVERRRSIDQAGDAINLETYRATSDRIPGTEIALSRLRHSWSKADLASFVVKAESFSPPRELLDPTRLRSRLDGDRLLFGKPQMQDKTAPENDPGFMLNLTGDFGFGSENWDQLIDTVEWILEINARASGVTFCVVPTEREAGVTHGHAKRQTVKVNHPDPDAGPFFHARILARSRAGNKEFRNWSLGVAGVRVYSEGFRVLPYGNPDNDWLEINRDYAARSRKVRLIEANRGLTEELDWDQDDEDLALTILPADSYVGAIFLTRERSGGLEMLVNREGFVPNRAFANLKDLTRLGIAVLMRARAAGRLEKREAAKRTREKRAPSATDNDRESSDPEDRSLPKEVNAQLESAVGQIAALRTDLAAGNVDSAERGLDRLEAKTDRLAAAIDALVAEQRLTPILASVGIQMGEFVHEINGLLAMAGAIDTVLSRLLDDRDSLGSSKAWRTLTEAHLTATDLRARLERQSSYLIDLTTPTAVRRRSRQYLSERIDRAAELIRPALERREVTFVNRVSPEIRTPAMFPAELIAVLLNLLTNAVKAAGRGGRILASARHNGDKAVRIRIENTGQAVDLDADPERWFRPFETTTTEIDPLLGQGMGFGLPITRDILDQYSARVEFVAPKKRFATAIQVEFRG